MISSAAICQVGDWQRKHNFRDASCCFQCQSLQAEQAEQRIVASPGQSGSSAFTGWQKLESKDLSRSTTYVSATIFSEEIARAGWPLYCVFLRRRSPRRTPPTLPLQERRSPPTGLTLKTSTKRWRHATGNGPPTQALAGCISREILARTPFSS